MINPLPNMSITYMLLGTIASFNWDTSQTTSASVLEQYHLSDQQYNICIRRSRGYCSICYSPQIDSKSGDRYLITVIIIIKKSRCC